MKIEIVKTGINGEGIGYIQNKPIFVPNALVGEWVDVEVVQSMKTYSLGKVNKILKQSSSRVQPKCGVQKSCGACPLMITQYEQQCEMKMEILKQSLIKYAQINPRLIQPILKSEDKLGYRNQCKLPFGMEERELVTGMYQPNSNYFKPIERCLIHEAGIERVRKELLDILNEFKFKAYDFHQKKGLRSLVIRGLENHYQITLVSGEHEFPSAMVEAIMQIRGVVSLWQSVLTQKKSVEIFGSKMIHLAGTRTLDFNFMGYEMMLSPRSFFQLNTKQAEKLYQVIESMVPDQCQMIVEAYSGIGGISLALHHKAQEIVGIESIKDAVVNANMIAAKNKIKNVKFVCDDAAFKLEYYAKKKNVDVLVVDPPRSGLDDAMLNTILKSKIKHIIYVSCNPATLGKNLAVLKDRYEVKKVQPIDMFPQTQHVESVVLLTKVHK